MFWRKIYILALIALLDYSFYSVLYFYVKGKTKYDFHLNLLCGDPVLSRQMIC